MRKIGEERQEEYLPDDIGRSQQPARLLGIHLAKPEENPPKMKCQPKIHTSYSHILILNQK